MDEELLRFKYIDLRLFAASYGFVVDKKASWRGESVMRHPNGDKIIVSQRDGRFVYWNPKDPEDRGGTILDFVGYRRKGLTLGQIRVELRQWMNIPAPPMPHLPPLSKAALDLEAVRKRYAAMPVADRHAYLEEARCVPVEVLQHPRFKGRIKIDRHGAAVFPHFDADGQVCGYELKNKFADGRTFTGFASGGRKGMFLSNAIPSDRRLVLTESGTDALSYAAIFGDLDVTRYGSIAGKPTPAQRSIMRAAILAMPGGSEIIAATDADDPGRALAAGMKEIFDHCGRADLLFGRDEPQGFKDWNDQLRARPKGPLPFPRVRTSHRSPD